MKTLYLIGGTMGVGKTTVSQALKKQLPRSVFLDGDWCWDAQPFQVTEETKAMVMDNICHLLNNFIRCNAYENVIFCWVMHEQKIIDNILARLDLSACRVRCISLTCSEDVLTARLQKDIAAGLRQTDVLDRSLPRLPLYAAIRSEKIDTTLLSPKEIAAQIAEI